MIPRLLNRERRFNLIVTALLIVVSILFLLPLYWTAVFATRTLAEVQYFNPAGVRLRTLLWPDPARDLETVLLVTNQ